MALNEVTPSQIKAKCAKCAAAVSGPRALMPFKSQAGLCHPYSAVLTWETNMLSWVPEGSLGKCQRFCVSGHLPPGRIHSTAGSRRLCLPRQRFLGKSTFSEWNKILLTIKW